MALDQRSLRLFEACSCKPASEGRPPSPGQHRAQFYFRAFSAQESSPWESHPQALAEPYVSLAAHTAPITQAADRKPSRQCANSLGSRLATRPSQALAQDSLRLNRLYFLIAHRTR